MINKRSAYRMVRTTVNVPAVRAFAVGGLGQLERGVGTNVLDVVRGLGGLVRVGVHGQLLGSASTAPSDTHRQILLVPVLLVLYLRHRRRLANRVVLRFPASSHL